MRCIENGQWEMFVTDKLCLSEYFIQKKAVNTYAYFILCIVGIKRLIN